MGMKKELGELKRLKAREVWDTEGQDFTPWLVENIDLLASVLDRDIEIEEREAPVGPFSADLVGRDINSQSVVVIENQFGTTDHDHLGKVLTYASGRDASVVVWIAEEFRDEHRSVMGWLNDQTGQDAAFFGIELQVLQVDDSKPAPNLKLVASPNWWERETREPPPPRQRAYRQFWEDFLTRIKAREPDFTAAKPLAQNWFDFRAGRSGFYYIVAFTRGKRFIVTLDIDTGDRDMNRETLEALQTEREMIEQEVGPELVREEPPERRRAARICIERPGSIDDPPEQLEELKEWGTDMLLRFRRAFSERIRDLEL